MRARDEIRLIIAALFLIQVILAFSAIGLLTRIKPAIEEILVENVVSIEAVDEMLVVLAAPPGPDGKRSAEEERVFRAAMERAQANVTEEGERPEVERLQQHAPAALAGEQAARGEVVGALKRLGTINVTSMTQADQEAKRLGTAGAWIAAFLGGLGFVLSVIAVRRLTRRFLVPLNDLAETVEAYRQGDLHRRFSTPDAPVELARVGETVNGLILDQLTPQEEVDSTASVDRAAVLFLLDALEAPAFILRADGAVMASNMAGADDLRTEAGRARRDRVHAAIRAEEPLELEGLRVRSMRGAAWLVEVL